MRTAKQIANLRPQKKGDPASIEKARRGGIASAIANKRRKSMQELCATMLAQELNSDQRKKLQTQYKDIDPNDLTAQAAVIAGQIASAIRGNSMAFAALIQLQKQEQEKIIELEEKTNKRFHTDLDIVADTFHPVARAIRRELFREFVLDGGRGSGKSSFVAIMILEQLKNHPDCHAVCVRKVGNTLKDSVYARLLWAIDKQGLTEEFETKASPLEITYKKTGQKIYFRGADKPEKIKSITPPFGYIGILSYEELDQFNGQEEIRNITQSVIRGGEFAVIFKAFNPPKSANNWANKYIKVPKDDMMVHHSTYHDVPEDWLGEPFLAEAEHLRKTNPEAYENEYEGIANGAGGAVFTQLEIRTISDEEIRTFDHIFQGVDWGLAPDPYAFVRVHYDRMRETIYFIDEYVVRGARNVQTAGVLEDRGYNDFPVTCDSAEKKSTLDYKDLGFNARNAKKGAGSVEYGMKWLAGRRIVIDPKRTPTVYEEYTQYEFDRDRDGNLITGYPDRNNHTIDATRYALEQFCNKRFENA